MDKTEKNILVINGGSSSIKFALYKVDSSITELLSGEIENIGTTDTVLKFKDLNTDQISVISISVDDYDTAAVFLTDWLKKQRSFTLISAIGHRIVHGMSHTMPEMITARLLVELKKVSVFDPEHMHGEMKLIELFKACYPTIPQIACFDTAFHADMPVVAKLLSIPRRYYNLGIHRYGFHGISYGFLMDQLRRSAGDEVAQGKVILAHLGSGASIAAVKGGKCIDTSMGFTPASGLVMGTRTGDLDPGVAAYLMQSEKLSPKQFNHLINYESGLLGISEKSSDMRQLIKIKDTDKYAAEAVELFCYQTKKWIGSFVAALGGLDTLVFSGGIGENIPEIRELICDGMNFLHINIDTSRNKNSESTISSDLSEVTVHVIKTNEELMIAKMVCSALNYKINNHN